MELHERGVLERYDVEILGARPDVIHKAEAREAFSEAMRKIGLDLPRQRTVGTYEEALEAREEIGLPCVIRPSFTMGGTGGGIAWNLEEYKDICRRGLELSLRSTRSSSRRASTAGRSSSSRSCATSPTTS